MGWLILLAVAVWGASTARADDVAPALPANLPDVLDPEARAAAQQLAVVAAKSKPAVRSGKQASPLVRELQRKMGDPDPDGRLGPMTRALAARYGVVIP